MRKIETTEGHLKTIKTGIESSDNRPDNISEAGSIKIEFFSEENSSFRRKVNKMEKAVSLKCFKS
jgi:hypothetical protein